MPLFLSFVHSDRDVVLALWEAELTCLPTRGARGGGGSSGPSSKSFLPEL